MKNSQFYPDRMSPDHGSFYILNIRNVNILDSRLKIGKLRLSFLDLIY